MSIREQWNQKYLDFLLEGIPYYYQWEKKDDPDYYEYEVSGDTLMKI